MSLHYLGIAHFPVLHRQFSSPQSKGSLESSFGQDLTQDNKDVLIERLNDLLARVTKDDLLGDSIITSIHTEVDRIEQIMRVGSRHQTPEKADNVIASVERSSNDEDVFWGPPTPSKSIRMRLPDSSPTSSRRSIHQASKPDSARTAELAAAAEELASQLAATVAEFQTRREESDHIHGLLITRAEKAAENILSLENRIAELEEDFEINQSELKFLRIQLQAIEAQSSPYTLRDEDDELTQSIMNWKIDWEDIDRRSKERKMKSRHAPVTTLDNSPTVVDGS